MTLSPFRSETLRERPARRRRSRRALSVGQKESQRTFANFSSVDKVEGSREVAGGQRRRLGKGNQVGGSGKGRRRRGDTSRASIALSSSEVKLNNISNTNQLIKGWEQRDNSSNGLCERVLNTLSRDGVSASQPSL